MATSFANGRLGIRRVGALLAALAHAGCGAGDAAPAPPAVDAGEVDARAGDAAPAAWSPLPNEGYGADTRGGLSGAVLKVTNLDDSGPGSLRAALEAKGPRTIVFEVGGRAWLARDIAVREPFVTVAGETAPSPGIVVANAAVRIFTHDAVVRHVAFRVGDDPSGPSPDNRDGIGIEGSEDGSFETHHVLLDHVSVAWAIDGNVDLWHPHVHDVTVRYSILAEGLGNSLHPKGMHSTALLIGDHAKRVAVLGNLFAHNNGRNPLFKGDTSAVCVNNLVYDPGTWGASSMGDLERSGPSVVDFVGNQLIVGPSPTPSAPLLFASNVSAGSRAYLSDNRAEGGALFGFSGLDPRVASPTMPDARITARPAAEVEAFVSRHAGARPTDRDAVDRRVVASLRDRSGRIIDSPKDVGGWPEYGTPRRPLNVPARPAGDDDGDGVSNLEEWLDGFRAAIEQ